MGQTEFDGAFFMIIPPERLSLDTLTALIEAFINREGTDYGMEEFSLTEKVEQVRKQLDKGEVLIVFDGETDSINLLPRRDALALLQS